MKPSIFLTPVLLSVTVFGQQAGISKAQISIPGVQGVLEIDVGPTTWEGACPA